MQRYPSPYHLSMETHLLIPATLYAPWVAPPTWRLPSHYHRHALHGLKYHIPPTFFPRYKQQLYQIKWFCTHTHNTHTHTHTHTHAHTQKGYTKASPQLFAQGPLNAPSHVSTFNQSAVTLLHKRTSRYLICHKCIIL